MRSPAIQAALDNLVEAIRTSLMAEFLELLRSGKPARRTPAPKRKPTASKKASPRTQAGKKRVRSGA